jgi:hypothetical protein
MSVLELSGADGILLVAALTTGAIWLAAACIVYLARRPPEPPVGPRTLDLGSEPPAIANFLVNGWRVSAEAVPATLLDLAARNVVDVEQRGPGVFYVRLRRDVTEPLTAYDRRVLEHLRSVANDDVVPAEALTTGPHEQSKRWLRAFTGDVVGDAKARGLSRDAVNSRVFTILTAAACVPAAFGWAVWEFEAAVIVVVAGVALLGWIRARHPQRETPAGMEAASRWLGVKAEIEENAEFGSHSPLTIEIWDRLLAYGAALGVASGASRPLPMGVESDTRAWSAFGGRWRPVRISYPRVWPIAWGAEPLAALAVGAGAVIAGSVALYALGPVFLDVSGGAVVTLITLAILAVPGIAVVLGAAGVVMALRDFGPTVEVVGPILRLRELGDDKKRRYYAAVDDGESDSIRAFRVSAMQNVGLEQGELVNARVTARLGCVRSIARTESIV